MASAEGERPISEIVVGELVLAYHEASGSTGYYTVTAVLVHLNALAVDGQLDGERIETTPEHPFFAAGRGWADAGELLVGEQVRQADGSNGDVHP